MTRWKRQPAKVATLSLFDQRPPLRQPSRNTDLETSHEAAHELVKSGKLTKQCGETLNALVRSNWASGKPAASAELAGDDQRLRYQYARRLPDLERLGLVTRLDSKRACAVTGANAFPWSVTETGMEKFREMRAAREAATK